MAAIEHVNVLKVKFDWVKKKKLPHLFWGEIKNKKKKTCLPHLFLQKVAWESNTFFFLALVCVKVVNGQTCLS